MPTYSTLPSLSANQVITASYVNQLNENMRVISKHNHSGSAGEGSQYIAVASAGASELTYAYEVFTCFAPCQQNFSTSFSGACYLLMSGLQTDTSIPASLKYPIGLFSGIYNAQVLSEQGASLGLASVLIGASSLGTFDMYASTSNGNIFTSLSASVPTSASYILTIRSDGSKNASSAGSIVRLRAVYLRRIGDY